MVIFLYVQVLSFDFAVKDFFENGFKDVNLTSINVDSSLDKDDYRFDFGWKFDRSEENWKVDNFELYVPVFDYEIPVFDYLIKGSNILNDLRNNGFSFSNLVGIPEPLTIFGAGTALGFGALFKRKLNHSKSTKKETTKVG